ncbi:hypothetical protein MMC19_004362 [Ptychographa xylographoides]|nr:hypothetical protein [Ptychographa xylographoides]
MSNTIVAIVTGANRGIGQAICQTITSSAQQPTILYATSRAGANLGIKTPPDSHTTEIKYPKLDITDRASIENLAETIRREHGGCDVLINNAGVNLDDEYSSANVRKTLDTNYRGTLHMCQTFFPLLKKDGRIVNVSSTASGLSQYSESLQERFRDSKMTLQDLEALMQEYQQCVDQGTEQENGWPRMAYKVSKSAQNAFTAVLARENPGLIVNACCPGWVATDMGAMVGRPPKTPEEGARIPYRLAFKDIDGVTGRYWGNDSISGRGEGKVQTW